MLSYTNKIPRGLFVSKQHICQLEMPDRSLKKDQDRRSLLDRPTRSQISNPQWDRLHFLKILYRDAG